MKLFHHLGLGAFLVWNGRWGSCAISLLHSNFWWGKILVCSATGNLGRDVAFSIFYGYSSLSGSGVLRWDVCKPWYSFWPSDFYMPLSNSSCFEFDITLPVVVVLLDKEFTAHWYALYRHQCWTNSPYDDGDYCSFALNWYELPFMLVILVILP